MVSVRVTDRVTSGKNTTDCCIISFGWFPDVCILCADVSEHCSNFIGGVSRKNAYTAYEYETECSETSTQNSEAGESPKRKNTTFRTRRKFEIKSYTDNVLQTVHTSWQNFYIHISREQKFRRRYVHETL